MVLNAKGGRVMTDEGDMRQLLGELLKGQERLEADVAGIRRENREARADSKSTRDMVLEHRTTIRVVKWAIAPVIAVVGALVVDWWQR